MSKIKWKPQTEIDEEKLIEEEKKAKKEKHKGKDETKLTQKEINELVIELAKERGLL